MENISGKKLNVSVVLCWISETKKSSFQSPQLRCADWNLGVSPSRTLLSSDFRHLSSLLSIKGLRVQGTTQRFAKVSFQGYKPNNQGRRGSYPVKKKKTGYDTHPNNQGCPFSWKSKGPIPTRIFFDALLYKGLGLWGERVPINSHYIWVLQLLLFLP